MTGQQLVNAAELNEHGHAYLRVRDPQWWEPGAYLRLSVLEVGGRRSLGPWAHLYSRQTQQVIGERTPQPLLTIPGMSVFDAQAFLTQEATVWDGPLDEKDK